MMMYRCLHKSRQVVRSYNVEMRRRMATFDESLLDVLACPLSKERLVYDEENNMLRSNVLNVGFPIVDGVPDLRPTSGVPYDDDDNVV